MVPQKADAMPVGGTMTLDLKIDGVIDGSAADRTEKLTLGGKLTVKDGRADTRVDVELTDERTVETVH